jgi:hypothetical protein
LLFGTHLQPILQENDPGIEDDLLEYGHYLQEMFGPVLGAKAHDPLDTGTVVSAAVEDHDFAGRGRCGT